MADEIFVTLEAVGYVPPQRPDLFTDTVSEHESHGNGSIVKAYNNTCMDKTFRSLVHSMKSPEQDSLNERLEGDELRVAGYISELLEKESASPGTFLLSYRIRGSLDNKEVSLDDKVSNYSSDITHDDIDSSGRPVKRMMLYASEGIVGGRY